MRLSATLALSALLLSSCANVCDRMCTSEADLFEGCLATWETSWEEQGYADRDEQFGRCSAVWGDAYDDSDQGSTERQSLSQECTSRLQRAESDTDCQSLLD